MRSVTDPDSRRRPVRFALAGLALIAAGAGCGGSGAAPAPASSSGGGGRSIYVAAQHAGEIDRFDATTLVRTATRSIGGDPHVLAWDSGQALLWVSSPKANSLRARRRRRAR